MIGNFYEFVDKYLEVSRMKIRLLIDIIRVIIYNRLFFVFNSIFFVFKLLLLWLFLILNISNNLDRCMYNLMIIMLLIKKY